MSVSEMRTYVQFASELRTYVQFASELPILIVVPNLTVVHRG